MYGNCCGRRGHGAGYGSGRTAGFGPAHGSPWGGQFGGGFGYGFWGPTKPERKEWLEAFKKHLEERLAEVNEELGTL